LFGTLKAQSFILTEVIECGLATVGERSAMSKEERVASSQAVGQDNILLAAHRKDLGGKATVGERSAMSKEERVASFQAVGQDSNLHAAYNMGHGSASTASARTALSAEERAAAMRSGSQQSHIVSAHKRGVQVVGTAEEYAFSTPAQQYEMRLLVDADYKRFTDENKN